MRSMRGTVAYAAAVGAAVFMLFAIPGGWATLAVGQAPVHIDPDFTLPFRGMLAGLAVGMVCAGVLRARSTVLLATGIAAISGPLLHALLPGPVVGGDTFSLGYWAVSLAGAALGAVVARELGVRSDARIAAGAFMAVLIVGFLWASGFVGGPARQVHDAAAARLETDLAADYYQFDGIAYLNTARLMSEGVPYYEAIRASLDKLGDVQSGAHAPETSPLTVREPFVFLLWAALGAGSVSGVWAVSGLLAVIAMCAAYSLAVRFVDRPVALISAVLLSTYFCGICSSLYFSFPVVYAGVAVLVSMWLGSRQRWLGSAVALVIAVAFREFALVFWPAWIAGWWAFGKHREHALAGLVALLGVWAPVLLHAAAIGSSAAPVDLGRWFNGGFDRLLDSLRFSGTMWLTGRATQIAAVVAALVGTLRLRPVWRRWMVGGGLCSAVVMLGVISGGRYSFYWGAIALPLALASAPIVIARWVPSRAYARELALEQRVGFVRVVIGVRDAEGWVADLLRGACEALDRTGVPYAMAVVDAGSVDGTVAAVRATGLKVRVVELGDMALADALTRGARAARGKASGTDPIILMDGVRVRDARQIERMVLRWRRGTDVVTAGGVGGVFDAPLSVGLEFVASLRPRILMPVEGVRSYRPPMLLATAATLRDDDGAILSQAMRDPLAFAGLCADATVHECTLR